MSSYSIGLEWGSISDMISATTSFFTLLIAFMAYRAAPKWVHQKADETSYTLASKLICESYPEILNNIERLTFHFKYLPENKTNFSKLDYIELVRSIERNDDVIWNVQENALALENNVRRLSRYGWNFNQLQKKLSDDFFNGIPKFSSAYISCSLTVTMLLWPDIDMCDNENDYEERFEYVVDTIYEVRDLFLSKSEVVRNNLSEFLASATRIEDFFTRNTK